MLNKDSLIFLEKLLNTNSPSGFEEEAISVYKEYLNQFCKKTYVDIMGNTVGVLNPEAEFKIMLAGHYDEIGFQVVYISDDGLIYFRNVGGIDKITVPGTEVIINGDNQKIEGVIGKKPIHLIKPKDRDNSLDLKEMWIDIGAKNKQEVEKYISVGNPISIKPNYKLLNNNRISSKALDDKIGAFVVAEVVKKLKDSKLNKNIGVYCVGTVQEEIGLRGSKTISFNISPNVGIAVDVSFATDTPDINVKEFGDIRLGNGPIMHMNADQNKKLLQKFKTIAKNKKIPFQYDAGLSATGGTDTSSIQMTKSGIPTILISIPTRYLHTPVEICDLNDVENAINLIYESILDISFNENFLIE